MDNPFIPRVLIGTNVDVISPFPLVYIDRLVKWTYQYKSLITDDFLPSDDVTLTNNFTTHIKTQLSYGVVDKHNKIGLDTDGPIVVGGFFVDPGTTPLNVYLHVISQRRAWGKGLMDEGASLVVKDLFDTQPELMRLSAAVISSNRAVSSFVEKQNFRREGIMRDMTRVNGKMRDVVLYGLTRNFYNQVLDTEENK